jgi:hypothetical protein
LKELGYNVVSVSEYEFNPSEEIEINNIFKCNNKYKMISNGKFIFKDIIAYLSPGTSLLILNVQKESFLIESLKILTNIY